jgi:hypothetical protein
MNRSYILLGSMLFACTAASSLTQCSGDSTTDGGSDASTDTKPAKDSPTNDAPGADVEAGQIVTGAGTQLDALDSVQIFGVTTDGFVIYADNSATTAPLWAVSQTGGTPVKIASPTVSSTKTYVVSIAGKVVGVWEGVTTSTTAPQYGVLSLWVSGGAYTQVSALSSPNAGLASSTDGTRVMYSDGVEVDAGLSETGNIVGSAHDGTGKNTLVTAIDVGNNGCRPFIGFAGGVNAVTSTCTAIPPDGGVPSATISSYSNTWAATQILAGALDVWATDTAGDKLLLATPSGLSVYPIGSNIGTPVDTTRDIQNGVWTFEYMNKLGTTVLYSTPAGELLTSPTITPTPLDVQATGAKFVRSISADENYMIYTTNFDSQQFGGDIYLTKTTAAAPAATALVTGSTTGALFGVTSADNFTTDSTHVMWIENLIAKQGIGDLYAMPVTGGTPTHITTAEWINLSATAAKIVFNDNCQNCSSTAGAAMGQADIKAIDLGTSNAATLLQASADTDIILSTTKDHVIYTYSQNPKTSGTPPPKGGNGLYSVAIP